MGAHVDILERHDSLRKPFLGSVALHAAVFGTLALYGAMTTGGRVLWGDPNSLGGGAVGITPVSQLPLLSRGSALNPLANDTESSVPSPPEPAKARKAREPDPDAISIKGKKSFRKLTDIAASRQTYRSKAEGRPNQLYSSAGQALGSPMFGGLSGGGGVGVGAGSPFGHRYGSYVEILRRRVAEKWRTGDVDPRLRTAPAVVVTFELSRDGSIRNVRLLQRSGNTALDYSAQRAIYEAAPFPPLPAGYERNEATIEFQFQLMR